MEQRELSTGLDAQDRIEVGERLVKQEGLRVAHDRATQGDALALTARQRCRPALQQAVDSQYPRHLSHAFVDARRLDMSHLQTECEVLANGLVRIERVALEHHRQIALLWRHARHVLAIDQDAPTCRSVEARDQPKDGALAAARRSNEHQQFAVCDLQIQVGQRSDTAGKTLADSLERDRRHLTL